MSPEHEHRAAAAAVDVGLSLPCGIHTKLIFIILNVCKTVYSIYYLQSMVNAAPVFH